LSAEDRAAARERQDAEIAAVAATYSEEFELEESAAREFTLYLSMGTVKVERQVAKVGSRQPKPDDKRRLGWKSSTEKNKKATRDSVPTYTEEQDVVIRCPLRFSLPATYPLFDPPNVRVYMPAIAEEVPVPKQTAWARAAEATEKTLASGGFLKGEECLLSTVDMFMAFVEGRGNIEPGRVVRIRAAKGSSTFAGEAFTAVVVESRSEQVRLQHSNGEEEWRTVKDVELVPLEAACEEAAAPQEPTMEEAFLRLPFLWAGLDAKESPLLHLIKEFELRALVFYGRPAILQIQGPAEDVERFAGVAKRREIVREHEIELRHRSRGPTLPCAGIRQITPREQRGCLDWTALRRHFKARGDGQIMQKLTNRYTSVTKYMQRVTKATSLEVSKEPPPLYVHHQNHRKAPDVVSAEK
jgi:hypothetical protein